GELVRVPVVVLRVEPNQLQQRLHGALGALRGGDLLDPQRSADDRTDGVPRVQRRVRVLEDHLYVPAQRPHGAGGQVRDVAAIEDDLPAGRFEQPGRQPAGTGLATGGLADEAERLPGTHGEVDAVDRAYGADPASQDDAARDRKVLLQPGYLKKVLGCRHGWLLRRGGALYTDEGRLQMRGDVLGEELPAYGRRQVAR